ncbi:MAG: hypothetical protein JWM11_2540 [Planctomycetaceae bacterium]|nr:hypothetical protein [Planctomycetaceae bacterium]
MAFETGDKEAMQESIGPESGHRKGPQVTPSWQKCQLRTKPLQIAEKSFARIDSIFSRH